MTINVFLSIVLIPLVVVGFAWGVSYTNKLRRVKSIVEKRTNQVCVLLNKKTLDKNSFLSKDEINTILSLSKDDWNEWDYLIQEVKKISEKYPEVFGTYLKVNFNKVLNRESYVKPTLFSRQVRKNICIIESMLLSELRIINSEPNELWKIRDEERRKANEIKKKFPNGVNTLKKTDKLTDLSDAEIIRNEKRLEQYQIMYEKASAYEGWKEKQDEFCKLYRKLLDENGKSGCYKYDVKIKIPKENGTLYDESFKIWQGYLGAFCEYFKEVQNDNYRDWLDKHLVNMKNRVSYYDDSNYDGLFKIIQEIEDKHEFAPLIIFVTESKRNWPQESYNYHYKRIKSLLNNDGYISCDLKDLNNIGYNEKWKSVIIIDLITSNEEMFNNASLVAEYFHRYIPVIGYYSIIKEYSEEEGKKIFKENFENLNYIREQFRRVYKNDRFSYLAITNTLIGNARRASTIKQIWLADSIKYRFEPSGYILSGKYSIDGGKNFVSISIDGDYNNFEDNVLFAYRLFEKMGVMKMFRQKGQNAIDVINDLELLS